MESASAVWYIPIPDPVEWDSRQLLRGSTSSILSSSFLLKHGQSSTTAFTKAISASDVIIFNEGIFDSRCSVKEEVVPRYGELCTVMKVRFQVSFRSLLVVLRWLLALGGKKFFRIP